MDKSLLKSMNIYLIGMMGSGKSTLGKLLAQQLDYRFFDTDIIIEKVAHQTIKQIFTERGESGFRTLESQVLSQLCAYTKSVIATGGGIVIQSENWGYLRHGLIIWLDTPLDLLVERLTKDNQRPLIQGEDLKAKLEQLMEQRLPLYQQADLKITISPQLSPNEITEQILELIPTVLKHN